MSEQAVNSEEAEVPSISPPSIDIALGGLLTTGGIALTVYARGFVAMIPGTVIGPGLLPAICGVIFIVTGIAIGLSGLRRRYDGPVPTVNRFVVIVPGLLAAFYLLTPFVGFAVMGVLVSFLYVLASGAGWKGAMIAALVLTGAVYLAFTTVMRVPLPVGSMFS